jgi:hypothetical protein
MNEHDYKRHNKRITMQNDPVWVESIKQLKEIELDPNMGYTVYYRKDKQQKLRQIDITQKKYVPENISFIFDDGFTLLDTEIVRFEIYNPNDYPTAVLLDSNGNPVSK